MNNTSNITVIKIGGSTLGETDSTFADIASLHKKGSKVVLIHGGGKEISKWINIQGIEPNFVDGLRVTDKKTLDVAIAVLSGKVNSEIVTEFQNMGVNSVGLAGSSGIIEAKQLDSKLGFVGEITKNSKININKEEVEELAKIPLFDLLEKQNKRYVSFTKEDERIDSRAYAYEDKLIWVASARMIIQLSELLED